MANPEHIKIVKAGPKEVEKWYKSQPLHAGFDLTNADLRKVNMAGMKLYRANLSRANLKGANLAGSLLMAAYLQEAYLQEAILEKANAARADFVGAWLDKANLRNTYLDSVTFGNANLVEADLTNANIRDAKFIYADLRNAILDGVVMSEMGPEGWVIKGVRCTHFYIEGARDASSRRRVPAKGYLLAGEFEDRFKSRQTIEYVFENGMPSLGPAVLDLAISQANLKNPKADLRLLDITARGGIPRAIIEITESPQVSKEKALALVIATYERLIEQLQSDREKLLDKIPSNKMLLPAVAPDTEIPAERRTTPLSLERMAQYWGGEMTAKKLKAMIESGRLKAIQLNRQTFVFDTKYLPAEVINKVKS